MTSDIPYVVFEVCHNRECFRGPHIPFKGYFTFITIKRVPENLIRCFEFLRGRKKPNKKIPTNKQKKSQEKNHP
jgi:hypothetical protein